jgi:hypothetical protein
VSYSDYVVACRRGEACCVALAACGSDEAVDHGLPELTKAIAVIFSFVGSNMTARKLPQFADVTNAMQAAKDVPVRRRDPSPVLDAAKGELFPRAEYEALGYRFDDELAAALDAAYQRQQHDYTSRTSTERRNVVSDEMNLEVVAEVVVNVSVEPTAQTEDERDAQLKAAVKAKLGDRVEDVMSVELL